MKEEREKMCIAHRVTVIWTVTDSVLETMETDNDAMKGPDNNGKDNDRPKEKCLQIQTCVYRNEQQ